MAAALRGAEHANAVAGSQLCEWQQQQLDPTLDGQFKQTDAVYLLLALARKYRFVHLVDGKHPRLTTGSSADSRTCHPGLVVTLARVVWGTRSRSELPRAWECPS